MIGEFELWWLISYPIVFAMGWFAARIDLKHLLHQSRAVPSNYFLGLKFLLSNQTDEAIEAFNQIVKTEGGDHAELYFGLGNLFRRRGEYERAIRIHQDLIKREDISVLDRESGQFELGMDFLKAGMLDRAEGVFSELLESSRRDVVLKTLLDIYQSEKSWQKAIDIAAQLPEDPLERRDVEVAHFYCELAQLALHRTELDDAEQYANTALTANRRSVRATFLLGDVAARRGEYRQAVGIWQRIETQNPDYLAMSAERLIDAYQKLDASQECLDLLSGYLSEYPSIGLLDAVSDLTLTLKGPDAAFNLIRNELKRMPTLLGLNKLIETELMKKGSQSRRSDLELAKNLVYTQTRNLARYRCFHCGFKARQFYWRCPGCGQWETYSPKRSEESNLA